MAEMIKITYVRSGISRIYKQRRTIKAHGFTKLHQSRIVADSSAIRGMIGKVHHLVQVEAVPNSAGEENTNGE